MLAIVIPYFKHTFFEETLASLAIQTNKEFTVYIGNDASSVDPTPLFNQYRSCFKIIYKKFNNNLGSISLTKQWERCINMTQNERWIMILGDDDYISENYIEEFYKQIEEVELLKINVIRFATRVIREDTNEISKLFTHPRVEDATDSFFRRYFKGSRGSLSEQIFRKESYLKYGFRDFPLGWGSDNFAWLDFTEFGMIYTINEATAFFRISNLNISRGNYQEEVKLESRYNLFSTIVFQYLSNFKPFQREPIMILYEKTVLKLNKLSFSFWSSMCALYWKENNYIQIFKFNRRLVLYLLKNETKIF